MPLKFVQKDQMSVFEEDGSMLMFRTPSKNELVAHSLRNGKIYAHAYVGVPVKGKNGKEEVVATLDFAQMAHSEIVEMLDSDIRFAADLLLSSQNVEIEIGGGKHEDVSQLDAEQKFEFLKWLNSGSLLFADFLNKFTTPQKKTSPTI